MKRLQNKWKKGVSVAMTVLLAGSSIQIPARAEEPKSWISKNALSVVESLEPVAKTAVAELSDKDRGQLAKEETVYVIANADGSPEKLIVSDWLKNAMGSETLEDSTELTDIINVKGTESFEQKEGSLGVWDAAGNDIYYQGSIEKELPVDLKVTYQLNGRTVSPDELAGQSGKVKIRFDYTNRQKETVAVGEKEEELYVPFAVITSLVLDNENFRNIEVSNGKVVNDGERTIIMGYAMPGLKENLDIGSEDFDVEELNIPDYVELTADVTDFELAATLTVAANEIFGDMDIDTQEKMDDLSADMDELQDAMNELMDGTAELYDGVLELYDGTGELTDGIDELDDGAKKLDDGAKDLDDGAGKLDNGAKDLDDGAGKLNVGATELYSGAGELYNGIGTLKSGAGALFAGVKQLADGLGQLTQNDTKLNQGAKAVYEGLLQLANAQLAGFSAYGVTTLDPSGKTPEQFCAEIEAGIQKLNVLADTLKASMPGLASRMAPEELPADKAAEEEQKEEVPAVSEEPAEKEEQPAGADTEAAEPQKQQPQDVEKVPAESGNIPEETKDQKQEVQKQEVQESEAQELKAQESEAQEQKVQEKQEVQEVQEVQEPASRENSQVSAEVVSEEENREAEPWAEVSERQTVLVQSSQAGDAQAAIAELKQKLQLIEMTKSTLQLLEGAYQVYMGVGSYTQGVDQIYAGVQELMKNAPTLNSGIDALSNGAGKLRDGAGELKSGTSELKSGTSELKSGTSELKSGTSELRDGTGELRDGTSELKDGGQELRDGVEELRDGSEELRDGTIEFNDEGIQKLTDKFNGDLRELSDRFEGVKSAARAYQSFAGISDKAEGNVRFIYKTAGIEK